MVDIGELNDRLTEAQLKADVAQLKSAVAKIMSDVERLGTEVSEVKIAIAGIDGRLDAFATKEDLHQQTWRIYGAMATLMAVFYFLVRYVH